LTIRQVKIFRHTAGGYARKHSIKTNWDIANETILLVMELLLDGMNFACDFVSSQNFEPS